jgi:hypothetical protein
MICPYLKSCQMLQNGIPRVYLYFCSTERNSESFSLLLKDSERNPESLLLFLLYRSEFRAFFSSAEFQESASIFVPLYRVPCIFFFHGNGLERNSERFLFHGTAGIPPERTKIVLSIPSSAEYFFCRKFPTLLTIEKIICAFFWLGHAFW